MLEYIGNFIVYVIAFLIGSVLALLAAKRLYPSTSEREALAELTAASPAEGDAR